MIIPLTRQPVGRVTPQRVHGRYADFIFALLVGLSLWFAHFGRATTYDGKLYPPMNQAFEFLFSYGRELALACMAATVLIYIVLHFTVPTRNFRGAAAWLVILNVYLSAKLLYYGNAQFFFEASAVIVLTVTAMIMVLPGAEMWSISRPGFHATPVIMSVWIFAFLISATNLVALLIHPDSALNANSRLHGTTVNPQHLAMMCALAVPGAAYIVANSGPATIVGSLSTGILCAILIVEYMTGSRMGFAAAVLGLVMALREYITGRKAAVGLFTGGLCLAIAFLMYGQDIGSLIADRFIEGREETRSQGWLRAWDVFLENPFFGTEPHEERGRLLFVENFWLAAASTGGLVALALTLPLLKGLVTVLLRFLLAIRNGRIRSSYGNFYLSGLVVLLGVSFFEAALLGLVATHTMLAYIYFAAATRTVAALDRVRRGRRYASGREVEENAMNSQL